MLDIGISFWEMVVVAVVALLVIGPEKLPGVVRTIGFWLGKARRTMENFKTDMDFEINKVEELKHQAQREMEIFELHQTIDLDKPSIAASTKPITSNTLASNSPAQELTSEPKPPAPH